MAQRVEVLLVDDLDGGQADETVHFGLDGAHFEIDLSETNAKELRSLFHPYMEAGRRNRVRRRRAAGAPRNDRERNADIRKWAKEHGIPVNERGRIPQSVIEQYEAAH